MTSKYCHCDVHLGAFVSASTFRRCVKKRKLILANIEEEPDQTFHAVSELDVGGADDVKAKLDATHKRFSEELIEQVVRRRVTAAGMTDVLKIFTTHYGPYLPPHVQPPTSWYMVQKLGCSVDIPAYVMQDFCPKCDCMFPRHGTDPTCARCKKKTRWNPRKQGTAQRQAVYFDMKDTYKCMFNSSVLLDELKRFEDEALAGGSIRDRELLNASDGTILHGARSEDPSVNGSLPDEDDPESEVGDQEGGESNESESEDLSSAGASSEDHDSEAEGYSADTDEEVDELKRFEDELKRFEDEEVDEDYGIRNPAPGEDKDESDEDIDGDCTAVKYTLYISLTADGTEVQKRPQLSFTPVTSKVLNLSNQLRSRMSNIQLHAVLPESIRDYNSMLRPVAEQLRKHRPGGVPIRVRHPTTGAMIHLFLVLAYTVNDIRGVPGCTGGSHAPSIEGSCVVCNVRGLRRQNRTIVPSSVRALGKNHLLRAAWLKEFANDSVLKEQAKQSKPRFRTKVEALESGARVMAKPNKSTKKEEAFHSVSVFSELLEYHDVVKHSKTDLAHEVGNVVKLVVRQVSDVGAKRGAAAFGARQKAVEVTKHKRFDYLMQVGSRFVY